MAPPTGVGAADTFAWDEAVNWQHNDAAEEPEPARRKSFLRKIGMTTQRKRSGEDEGLPPFRMRQVPYDTWRKHYAKDKDGNYHGTHAPAEDCLLKPDDVKKWRLGDPVTRGDRWTRGPEALPVYAEVRAEAAAPDYEADSLDDPRSTDTERHRQDFHSTPLDPDPSGTPRRNTIADGKTAEEIIAEARAKGTNKMSWKERLHKGAQLATMGN
ncbi:hypothetical protein B0A52_05180 [Exophiala mesophila]|uniref:Uncharacterized protein n=1 Tax=Exophiala mesophila TaxID=212818 RepID=A0A438N4H7_EXOME|nr:hypothetical protein B0A52_05180 [Exophiala mesophila]